MKLPRLFSAAACVALCVTAAGADDLDTAIAKLSGDISSAVSVAGVQKLSVIDFTDLQGRTSELGRFVAEQLSVSLVLARQGFAVVDRANMKSILEEHKLTASGLVNPENARKLGQFSGVDSIVLGSITVLGNSLSITVKVISTETTQVIAASRVNLPRSKEIDSLLGAQLVPDSEGSPEIPANEGKAHFSKSTLQRLGNLQAELLQFIVYPNGSAFAAVQISNTSKNVTIAISANSFNSKGVIMGVQNDTWVSAKIVDDRGNLIRASKVEGLGIFSAPWNYSPPTGYGYISQRMRRNDSKWAREMTDVRPGESLRVSIEFQPIRVKNAPPPEVVLGSMFELQLELITLERVKDPEPLNPRLQNVLFANIVMTVAEPR